MVKDEWSKLKNYKGEWVAVFRDRVIAHGKDPKRVYQQALRVCKIPRIFQVPDEADEVYLLWL